MQAITNVAKPLIDNFQQGVLTNANAITALETISQSPILQGVFNMLKGLTTQISPALKTITVGQRNAEEMVHLLFTVSMGSRTFTRQCEPYYVCGWLSDPTPTDCVR